MYQTGAKQYATTHCVVYRCHYRHPFVGLANCQDLAGQAHDVCFRNVAWLLHHHGSLERDVDCRTAATLVDLLKWGLRLLLSFQSALWDLISVIATNP